MITALLVMIFLAVVLGLVLGYSAIKFKVDGDPMVARIDAILPQTQCGQCGYPGCKPYANAIAKGEADINQCPPGGDAGAKALAELMGMEFKPLNQEHGVTIYKIPIKPCVKNLMQHYSVEKDKAYDNYRT